MNTEHNAKTNYLAEIVIGLGYILFFCLAFALCSTFYYISYLQPQPAPGNAFATRLPPTTPTPHILPETLLSAEEIFKDDFSDDSHVWAGNDDSSKTQVTLGKLLFQSQNENSLAFTGCGYCPTLASPFYLQADFSAGRLTDKGYGVYFNYDDASSNGEFFLFRINPEARKYYFYQGDKDGWSLLAAGESSEIKSFPGVNKLGIYAAQDVVEFYVNGKIIDSYKQSGHSFHTGGFGFYTDGSASQVVIDNLLITKAENKSHG